MSDLEFNAPTTTSEGPGLPGGILSSGGGISDVLGDDAAPALGPPALGPPVPRNGNGATGLGSERYLRLFERLTPLVSSHERREIAVRACDLLAEMLEVEACSVLLAGPRGGALRLAAATHIPEAEWPAIEVPADSGVCGEVYTSGRPLLLKGQAEFRNQFGRESQSRYSSPSCVIVPLAIRGRVAGVINVANPIGRRNFRARDVEMLEAAAKLIGGALESALAHCELMQLHKNLESIFDNLLMAVIAVDGEGSVVYCNEQARKLFGRTDPPPASIRLAELVPGTLFNVCRRLIKQSEKDREPANERLRVTLRQRPAQLALTVSRMRGLGDTFGEALIMIDDLSQDEEVARLRESENSKRSFLSTISHELRTPLAVLRGAVPLIDPDQGREISSETLRQVHKLLGKNCHRLNEVVSTILDVTEIESGTLQLNTRPVNLHEMLDEIVNYHAENAAAKQVQWDCRFEAEESQVVADPRRLRQVLSELVANAVKFSNREGRIGVATRVAAGSVEIDVSNTGSPITPEGRTGIFEKFYQCNQTMTRTVGGCGLGLYLAQNIIRLHGGRIELLDAEADQTVFRVHLPLPPGPAVAV